MSCDNVLLPKLCNCCIILQCGECCRTFLESIVLFRYMLQLIVSIMLWGISFSRQPSDRMLMSLYMAMLKSQSFLERIANTDDLKLKARRVVAFRRI